MISRNGAYMRSSQLDLQRIEQDISRFNQCGQLRRAVYCLLGRNDDLTDRVCRTYRSVTASSSIEEDSELLRYLFGYDTRPHWLSPSEWAALASGSLVARKVLEGALMLIGFAVHNISEETLSIAKRAAGSVPTGKLYNILATLFAHRLDEANALCDRLKLRFHSDDSIHDDVRTLRRFGFSIQEHSPDTFVQAALLLLGLEFYERKWSEGLEQGKSQNTWSDASSAGKVTSAQEVRRLPPATALLLVVRASKIHGLPMVGGTVTSDEVDGWLLGATYFTCLQPAQADELEGRLRLEQQLVLVGEEYIYVRVMLPPESGVRGKVTKFDIRESIRIGGRKNAQVLKVGRLDVRDSGDAMSQFVTT